jgi:thiol-disulfide isomerase/thioredoxin
VVASLIPLCWLLAVTPLKVGDAAPASVNVVTLAGQGHRTNLDLAGAVTIVDFFATWCPGCRESVGSYEKLAAEYGERLRIVVVDVGEQPATVRRFFALLRLPENVTVALDSTGTAMRSFGANGFPTFFVLDQDGIVRAVFDGWGQGSAQELSDQVGRLLRKPSAPVTGRGKKRHPPASSASPAPRAAKTAADERALRIGVEVLR